MASLKNALCLAAAVGPLAACAAGAEPVRSARHTIAQGQSVDLAPSVSLSLDSVSDSRCRRGTMCVWAGTVTYHFTIKGPAASEPFALTLEAPTFTSAKVLGTTIALAGEPPPVLGEHEALPAYSVTVQVGGQ